MSTEEEMHDLFKKFAGKDEKLCRRELKNLAKELGIDRKEFKGDRSREEMKAMIKSWNTDGEKGLTWDEFKGGPMKEMQKILESDD